MRLACPNCDAEYEVDAGVIPDGGRDVQCSNCGHGWFQLPPEAEAELAAEAALYDAPAPIAGAAQEVASDAPPRSGIDESVLSVLREEAERETAARRAEAPQGIETQTEMGLQPTEAAGGLSGAVARRIARLKGIDPVVATAKPQTRREMLPEIEEINSSLRASSEKRSGEAAAVAATMAEPARKSGGFRNGFVLMVLLAVALVAVYVMAPKIAAQIPGATGALTAYVAGIDGLRVMLDAGVQSAIGWLRGAAGGAG